MLFFSLNAVRFQMIVLVSSLLLITGCTVVQPETASSSDVATQIPDQQALAEYQLQMSNTDFGAIETAPSITNDEIAGPMADHQALAEYQLQMSNTDFGSATVPASVDTVWPNQIPDRQALAEYQLHLSGGTFGQ